MPLSTPNALVMTVRGSNCHKEMEYALQEAGAKVAIAGLGELASGVVKLADFQVIGRPGGFGNGDHIRAGVVQAAQMESEEVKGGSGRRIGDDQMEFKERGGLGISVCNGFQAAVASGIIPYGDIFKSEGEVTLTRNTQGHFYNRPAVSLETDPGNRSLFIGDDFPENVAWEVANAEGRVKFSGPEVYERLAANGQIVWRYGEGHNPNGSDMDVAGICDESGQEVGLMPHPERSVYAPDDSGMRIFKSMVQLLQE